MNTIPDPRVTHRYLASQLEKLVVDKHFSLFWVSVVTQEECYIAMTPGCNVIELFTAVIYESW
jgi:hypothetical protein